MGRTDDEQQVFQSIEILKDIAESLNEANDISAAMAAILPRLSHALGLATAWAFRYDPNRHSFVEVGASGLPPALAANDAAVLKCGWCECQDQFVEGRLDTAVNIVRCSRLRDVEGDKQDLNYHASIPLRSKGKPLGILNVAASGHQVFTNEALALLTAVGHQVAIAVDRAALLGDERRRGESLQKVSDIATELVSIVDPQRLFQFSVTRFLETFRLEACGIAIPTVEHRGETTWNLLAAAHAQEADEGTEYQYETDGEGLELPGAEQILLPNARSFVTCPIPHTEYWVRLESRTQNRFTSLDKDILRAFAAHLAVSFENAKLYEQSLENAKWTERRQLAADLHDAVSQRLFSAQLTLKSADLLLAQGRMNEAAAALTRVQQLISDGQGEMRGLIQALRPADERGFTARLRERVSPLQLHGPTRIHLHVDKDVDTFICLEACEALLFVADEALHNVLKHANAKQVHIHVVRSENRLLMTIQDDGQGFDESGIQRGLGTSTMFERMQRANGTLRLFSEVGKGTTVTCELPLEQISEGEVHHA